MATTPILGITQVSASQNNKEVTINDAVVALENATNAKLAVSFTGSSSVLLSNNQATRNFIFVAESASSNCTLSFPNNIGITPFNRVFAVRNISGFQLTVRFNTGAGSTVVIPNGETRLIAALDGDNMVVAAQPGTAVTFLSLSDTPSSFAGKANNMLVVNVAENALEFVPAAAFPSYAGNAGKVLAVTTGADGVEWIDATEAATFLDMTDTPASYVGQAGRFVAVNEAENGLAFVETPDPEATLFATARRWRILVVTKGTEASTGFGEVQFLDKDGFNLVGTGTATASNSQSGFEPGLAFDGSLISGTGWRTQASYAGEVWLEYEFATAVSVRQVRLNSITDAAEFTPTRIKFQFWSGTAWVEVGDRVTQPWVSGNPQTFRINGLPFINLYPMSFFFTGSPTSSQVLYLHTVTDACTIADDFAGSVGDVGTNPSSSFVMDVAVNGTNVGTITIATTGIFTFNTTAGAISLVAGDRISVTAPASVDTPQNVSVSLRAVM